MSEAPSTLDAFDPATIAADYVTAALGVDRTRLLLSCLRAGWLTPEEAGHLHPLAAALAAMIGAEVPPHRGGTA